MTPKEKAEELVLKYLRLQEKDSYNWFNKGLAKQCALIAVDEILKTRPGFPYPDDVGLEINGIFNIINYPTIYWKEVKQEIEKL